MNNLKVYTMMMIRLMSDPMTGEELQEQHNLLPLEQTTIMIQEEIQEEQLEIQEELVAESVDKGQEKPLSQINYFESVPLGRITTSSLELSIQGQQYPLYYYQFTNFISTTVLQQIGFSLNETEQGIYITKKEHQEIGGLSQIIKPLEEVDMSDKRVYIGNCLTYSLKSGEDYLIPLRSLSDYYTLQIEDTKCYLNAVAHSTTEYVSFEGNKLSNKTEDMIGVELYSLYINEEGNEAAEVQEIILNPKEEIVLTYTELEGIQVASLITKIDVLEQEQVVRTIEAALGHYGQAKITWLPTYNQNKLITNLEELEALFPTSKIIGTMKYDFNGFVKGEQVEVLRANSGSSYYVDAGGREVRIPWNSISIPSNPKANTNLATTQQIEAYVNKSGFSSDTNYLVWTDIYRQRTYVFTGEEGAWVLERNMLCTTGKNTTPTPRGGFKLQAYVPYFGLNKGYMCKDAVQIYGDYLYHSVMLDPTGSYVLNSNGPLGQQGSQGCIRLSVEDANWFYNTLPLKTTVYIN